MTLREKILKLLDVPNLPTDERKMLDFVVTTTPEGPLEEVMYPDVKAHVDGRFEWYYRPNGESRRKAA